MHAIQNSNLKPAHSASQFSFRDATEAEAAMVLQIERDAFGEYNAILDPPSSVFRETADDIRAKMQHGTFVLATLDGALAGMVFYQPQDGYMYLGRLSVLTPYRQQGLGAALLAHAEAHARAAGFARMRLRVRIVLPQLRARYERHGYRVLGEYCHPGYSQPTFIEMEKDC